MGKGAPRTSVDVVTARALRVALDRGRSREAATAGVLPACHGSRRAAAGALDRLERAFRAEPDDVLARAVDALRSAVELLPEPAATPRSQLHLLAPPS
jgi:MoxR-like ATPase